VAAERSEEARKETARKARRLRVACSLSCMLAAALLIKFLLSPSMSQAARTRAELYGAPQRAAHSRELVLPGMQPDQEGARLCWLTPPVHAGDHLDKADPDKDDLLDVKTTL